MSISTESKTSLSSLIQNFDQGPQDVFLIENEGSRPGDVVESMQLREEAAECGLRLTTYSVDDFELVSNHENTLFVRGSLVSAPPIVLARGGAETSPRGLKLLRHFELSGSLVLNSTASVERSRCKFRSAQLLSEAGLAIPTTISVSPTTAPQFVERHVGTPVVVKYAAGTRGEGVCKCTTIEDYEDLMLMLGAARQQSPLIAQEFIKSSSGRDLRVLVVDNQVVGCMQREGRDGKWKANIALGGRLSHYQNTTPEIDRIAVAAASALGLKIAGVDLLFGPEGPIVCEVNSAPDFDGVFEASGGAVNVPAAIVSYIGRLLGDTDRQRWAC